MADGRVEERISAHLADAEESLADVLEELGGRAAAALRRHDRSRGVVYLAQLARIAAEGEATLSRVLDGGEDSSQA